MSAPKVSIGVPVHNGERFLPQALRSLVEQDFDDLEIIISDNASVDATPDICAEFARRDERITYVRQPANIGAIPNYRYLLAAARGEYFRWAAADDEIGSGYLADCVEILDRQPAAIQAHTGCVDIDAEGRVIANIPPLATDDDDPLVRLRALLGRHESLDVYGLVRRSALRSIRPFGSHPEADRVVIVELALRGRFAHVPGDRFRRRRHERQSLVDLPRSSERVAWLDPARAGHLVFPAFELARDLVRAIHEAPLTRSQRLAAYAAMRFWFADNAGKMVLNLGRAGLDLMSRFAGGAALSQPGSSQPGSSQPGSSQPGSSQAGSVAVEPPHSGRRENAATVVERRS
jgi:glycosyltransferase involved in cell wall biosynthesis